MTLCLHDPERSFSFPSALYVVPIIGGSVYISKDDGARNAPKTTGIQDLCSGELTSADAAPDRIIYHVAQTFGHDCYPHNAR
jgi:hypothetical protein